jgi:hypothetical protein
VVRRTAANRSDPDNNADSSGGGALTIFWTAGGQWRIDIDNAQWLKCSGNGCAVACIYVCRKVSDDGSGTGNGSHGNK